MGTIKDRNSIHLTEVEDIKKRWQEYTKELWFFQWSCIDVRVGLQRKLTAEEWMLLNCGAGEYS